MRIIKRILIAPLVEIGFLFARFFGRFPDWYFLANFKIWRFMARFIPNEDLKLYLDNMIEIFQAGPPETKIIKDMLIKSKSWELKGIIRGFFD